jgi:hypothetical protein
MSFLFLSLSHLSCITYIKKSFFDVYVCVVIFAKKKKIQKTTLMSLLQRQSMSATFHRGFGAAERAFVINFSDTLVSDRPLPQPNKKST